jgi:hypothetical protein
MLKRIVDFASSLKLTIICLAAALLLVLAGTLAQMHFGIHEVQERYFQSLLILWPSHSTGFRIPVFPGGHLLGGILLFNLIAAHIRRFQWTWRKAGIQLAHFGLIIMLAGGLFTDLFAVESYMRLAPGETKNYSEDSLAAELAVIDETDSELDQVTAIPAALLRRGGVIEHSSMPFRIIVRHFYPNSEIQMLAKGTKAQPAATQGIGAQVTVTEIPRATAADTRDAESAVIEIVPLPVAGAATAPQGGTWLVSDGLGAPQGFQYAGKKWRLAMRPARHYKPYSLMLQKFTHERYAGTDINKNFASRVTLIDPERSENRDVLIYMNHPLRYRGDTFYQASFEKGDAATILEAVHNPSFIAPYVACVIVAAGLLVQFSYHLAGFSRRHKAAAAQ